MYHHTHIFIEYMTTNTTPYIHNTPNTQQQHLWFINHPHTHHMKHTNVLYIHALLINHKSCTTTYHWRQIRVHTYSTHFQHHHTCNTPFKLQRTHTLVFNILNQSSIAHILWMHTIHHTSYTQVHSEYTFQQYTYQPTHYTHTPCVHSCCATTITPTNLQHTITINIHFTHPTGDTPLMVHCHEQH